MIIDLRNRSRTEHLSPNFNYPWQGGFRVIIQTNLTLGCLMLELNKVKVILWGAKAHDDPEPPVSIPFVAPASIDLWSFVCNSFLKYYACQSLTSFLAFSASIDWSDSAWLHRWLLNTNILMIEKHQHLIAAKGKCYEAKQMELFSI